MLPFSGFGPIDGGERKALLFAAVFCCLFIVVLALARPHPRVKRVSTNNFKVPTPTTTNTFRESQPSNGDPLEKFRVKPQHFDKIDFLNYSYGPYTTSNGTKIPLHLQHSQLDLPNDSGWFALNDVYYKDVTGDEVEEAIVWLSHVQCSNGSCNGGSDMFYIFTMRNGKLKPIWEYETGNNANGCGLKFFTLSYKHLALVLFGECPKPAIDDPAETTFIAKGFTSILFEFDGRRFEQTSTEFFITPPTNIRNYEPTINIY